ncbi:MAG: aspartyl protease [Oculatellaceae cyanobacterium Prado106]|nr:aspartyl protease [Oculatellaceae cyanobacterium Prado106]
MIAKQDRGIVTTTLTVTNLVDAILAERGFIPSEEVRSLTLENVLVDTSATRLCLPASMIAELELPLAGEIDVKTAIGLSKARLFKLARLTLLGRQGEFTCIELPGSEDPLLGVIPLEELGLQPDVIQQKLVLLPDQGSNTYHLAY